MWLGLVGSIQRAMPAEAGRPIVVADGSGGGAAMQVRIPAVLMRGGT
ncbi:MAG: hypothetical protein COT06_06925, partial [Syntrophobacteraceae bacterium CG07_land_8_20_14_0_80_61_8]